MNNKAFRYRHCERKKQYKSEKKALNVLAKLRKRGYIVSSTANAYKCKFCGKWHLGHAQGRLNETKESI